MIKFKEGDSVIYFAERNLPTEEYSGPYPGKVKGIVEAEKKTDPQRVQLVVRFSPDREHEKTNVLVVDAPRKHCCTSMPTGYTYDDWYEKHAKEAQAKVDADLALANTAREAEEGKAAAAKATADAERAAAETALKDRQTDQERENKVREADGESQMKKRDADFAAKQVEESKATRK